MSGDVVASGVFSDEDLEFLRDRLFACLAAVRQVDDPVEREALARALGEVIADRLNVLRVVRSRAVRDLQAEVGLTLEMAGAVLGLSKSTVAKLARHGDAPVVVATAGDATA